MSDNVDTQGMPQPNPALKALDRFIGTWEIIGRTEGAKEDNIKGKTTFTKLPGGFFVMQHIQMDFAGMTIDATELIGYNEEKQSITSSVYTTAPSPLPYSWKLDGDNVEIEVVYGPFDAAFKGKFLPGGKYTGSWRPNPGADPNVNVPYDITGHKIED